MHLHPTLVSTTLVLLSGCFCVVDSGIVVVNAVVFFVSGGVLVVGLFASRLVEASVNNRKTLIAC